MRRTFQLLLVTLAMVLIGHQPWSYGQTASFPQTQISPVIAPPPTSTLSPSARPREAESLSQEFRRAANQILPSVVKIQSTSRGTGQAFANFYGLRMPVERPEQVGLGSGIIIDSAGIVLTNNHVVKSADEIVVILQDGTELFATEVSTDPLTDLAIVRVRPSAPLPAAEFGDSEELQIGDWVLAVGHPLELETSVSAGIISAKGRSLERVPRAQFLQTDAAINPGNSGGPLVDLSGRIVGINTAIASQTGGYQGIGFAVPVNLVKDVVGQLKTDGQVRRGFLGVSIQPLTRELAEQMLGNAAAEGVLVTNVRSGTPAEVAGVRAGDVITRFAGIPVNSPSSLQRAVERVPIGTPQRADVTRFGQQLKLSLSSQEFSAEKLSADLRGESRRLATRNRPNNKLGFEVDDLADLARTRGIDTTTEAVVITRVERDSLAADERLRGGQIILQVGDQPVRSVDEFRDALRNKSLQDGILFLVRDPGQDGADRFVVLRST